MTRTIAALLLAGVLSATEANAGGFFRRGHATTVATYSSPTPGHSAASVPTSRLYSYSYYTRSTLPARTYVGYGTNDFPYHGSPYGHPYDPYTWDAMSGSYNSSLAHYYYPPLK
jgi:hypothetical protein